MDYFKTLAIITLLCFLPVASHSALPKNAFHSFHLPEINQIIFISIYKHQMKGLGLSFIYKLLAVVAPQSIHEDRYRKYNQNNRIRFGCHNYICLDELDQEFIPLGSILLHAFCFSVVAFRALF